MSAGINRVIYTKDPMMPPKEPTQLCKAIPNARLVGDPRILFEFQAMVMAIAEKPPIAARNVAIYREAGVTVVSRMVNPTSANKKLKALT